MRDEFSAPPISRPLPPVLRGKRIGIIGAGNMGQALVRGMVLAGRVRPHRVMVVEVAASKGHDLQRRYHVRLGTIRELARRCDAILLAVKPQDAAPVLGELGRCLRVRRAGSCVVISIAAGLTIASLERQLGGRVPVVRVMPNLAATVGSSMSAIAASRRATRAHRQIARAIVESVGDVVELPERDFDVVTAISGSGPAYFFLLCQVLRDAGMRRGLSASVAERLAVRTAFGSAILATINFERTREPLETLIRRVASKKGTTEAALKVFARRKLSQIIDAGVAAAATRSKELSCLLSKS